VCEREKRERERERKKRERERDESLGTRTGALPHAAKHVVPLLSPRSLLFLSFSLSLSLSLSLPHLL